MEQIVNLKLDHSEDLTNNINQNQLTNYVVYLLVNTVHNKTYIGITNNPTRRLRQHNGELVGGAKYTTSNKNLKVKTFFPGSFIIVDDEFSFSSFAREGSLTNLAKPNLLSSMLDFESKDSKLAGSLSKKSLDFSDNLAKEKVKTFSLGSLTNLAKPNLLSSMLDFESKDSKLAGSWIYYGFIKNLHKNLALSLEKKIKIKSKKKSLNLSENLAEGKVKTVYPKTPIEKRLKAIEKVLEEYNLISNTNYKFEKLVIT
jgi:predicted GIY-YIG superfamily endonuclease